MNRRIGRALVVGAGIGGIRAALDLAEFGYGVTLIDRQPHMGGILSQLDNQFPTDRCGMCKMLPRVHEDSSSQVCLRRGLFHENIELLLSSELASVSGEAGRFQVTLRRQPVLVDPERCLGCGRCEEVCPVEVPDPFNQGLTRRKAIRLPVPHAIPNAYAIDPSVCTFCGACAKVCPNGAIRLHPGERKAFHILVVDDEMVVSDSLKEWLEEEGYAVDTAPSGPEALAILAKGSFQLMLLDIKMPGMDGVEVLKKAKEVFPEICVVMMTAYATVETAVEAMKIGALDYLVKPFDPEAMMPMVQRIYQDFELSRGLRLEVGAVVVCGGTDYFNPATGKNTLGYAEIPHVVTNLEFERILSGTGPSHGKLVRPADGKPIRRIAWLQCAGSRDLQAEADYCSSICCMIAVKEALLAKERAKGNLEAAIFYMDMRTFGKSFQRYRDQAEKDCGVRFKKARVHSVVQDPENGDLAIRYADMSGAPHEEYFDMAVLSVGQRPSRGIARLAEITGISLNPWGFPETEPFSASRTCRKGIVVGGSFSGLRDIGETLIAAGSAALNASRIIHAAGGGLFPEEPASRQWPDVMREVPRIFIAVCTCANGSKDLLATGPLSVKLGADPAVTDIVFIPRICTTQGWEALGEHVEKKNPNRILIGACLPCVYARKLKELGERINLNPSLMEVVDMYASIRTPGFQDEASILDRQAAVIREGIARLRRLNPMPAADVEIKQRALVAGGGIAGMTSALAVADHGFEVDLVERSENLGGNLLWIRKTLEGHPVQPLLDETIRRIESHPRIRTHLCSEIIESSGQVGNFQTMVVDREGKTSSIEHGIAILATGGKEAETVSYGFGRSPSIITQKQLEEKLGKGIIQAVGLNAVVMIQCVDSRQEPRNYCSRICCASAVKHALELKGANPGIDIYIFYRDIMTYGFAESDYTRARQAGVIFIPYDTGRIPQVKCGEGETEPVQVTAFEPTLGRAIEIKADLVVLAPGVVPTLPVRLAEAFGARLDPDGFFQEAESKWRPVESLREGVFACGLAHSPRTIAESIAGAEAAAARALRILSRKRMPAGRIVARVRHSLCSLCERCLDACPYGARSLDAEMQQIAVNPIACQGCGACAAVCPNGASIVEGFRRDQMLEIIDAAVGM